jgi:hypothetical protein
MFLVSYCFRRFGSKELCSVAHFFGSHGLYFPSINPLDLSVFDVVVDAKAIEAAANQAPPVHEPNDTDDPYTSGKNKRNTQHDADKDGEVVIEEDADGPVIEGRSNGGVLPSAPAASIWPDDEDHGHDAGADFAEPSMEEFFFHQEDDPPVEEEESATCDNDDQTPTQQQEPTASSSSNTDATEPATATATSTSSLPHTATAAEPPSEKLPAVGIALVPTKSAQKSKRAKFRSVATRKRK